METSTLNVQADANDKKNFEQFCDNVGMNVSTAINMFMKAVLREQKSPFEVRSNFFDDLVYEKLQEAELEMSNTSKRYSKEKILESMNKMIRVKIFFVSNTLLGCQHPSFLVIKFNEKSQKQKKTHQTGKSSLGNYFFSSFASSFFSSFAKTSLMTAMVLTLTSSAAFSKTGVPFATAKFTKS